MMILDTKCGKISGLQKDGVAIFLGVPYARAGRFEYAQLVNGWEGLFDAGKMGKACPQMRTYHEHLEIEERLFYHREFRDGLEFEYDEDCLNLNIFAPEDIAEGGKKYPVMIFIHGGGFDSGANSESAFDGSSYAKRGIITVFINYRVGIFGYLSHPELQKRFGRSGNFGLDDQLTAIKWIRNNIGSFGGDEENITLAGQSAGAISIQYLCLNHDNEGLFKNAFMISGGGKFPDFALPRPAEETYSYWTDFMKFMGLAEEDFDGLKNMDCKKIFDAMDEFKGSRKDNTYNTMPVIDGTLIKGPVKELIKNPLKINYLLGYTNCDLYAPLMALIGHKFVRKNRGYIYFFDVDAKGDGRKAFHSSDLRFIFGTLNKSWRPYDNDDYRISKIMQSYIEGFVKKGIPEAGKEGADADRGADSGVSGGAAREVAELPVWERGGKKALCFGKKIGMVRPPYLKLTWNMLFGGKQI